MMVCLLGVGTASAQAYDWKQVKLGGGGFVTGITFHPNVSGLMYCRTDIGGAYRWNPATNSWTQLLDFLGFDFWPNDESSLHGVESIGLDAQDPNRLYLACGWLSSPNEIFISTNQGASFTRIAAPFQIRANNDGRGTGERFGVDPNLGSTIFYGTRSDGLWKSTNHAANWSKVASFPVNSTANGVGISFVEFVAGSGTPGNATPVVWVGVSLAGTNLYRSVDGGLTWESVAHGAPAGHMPMRAAQDGQGNVYITFCDGAGPNGISAGSVRKINLSTLASTGVTPPTGNGGFGGVSVDRQNPNTVVVTTVNRWWPMSHIYRSTNGGASWSSVYSGTVDMSSSPYMNPDGGTVIEGWMFDIKIDPYNSDRVYYVTGGGVFSSYNFTAGQPSWEFRSDGIEEGVSATVGMNLACPPEGGPQLYSAFGDIGGFAHYDLDTSPPIEDIFFNPQGGNNYGVNFAEQSPNIVVRTYYSGSSRGGCISYDWGKTWTIFPTKPVPMTTEGPGYVALSADASRLVWAAPGNAPFYSTNGGATWNPSTGPSTLTPGPGGQDTLVADRVNPNKFYIYSPGTGRVFVSTDGGVSYTHTATITGSWDHSVHTPFGQEGQVWIAVYDGLWRSTNSGTSFTKVSGVQAARSIGFGRTATGTGYPVAYLHGKVGGVWGVYRSENQGASWIRINDDQHQFGGIAQVIGDPKIYGRCYIKALGIHYGDIPNLPPPAPVNLVATASTSAVQLSWSNISTADSYTVKRGTTSGGGHVTIASGVTATSYSDNSVVNGTTYYYVVAAANAFGVGADSAEASATPTDAKALYALEGNAQDTSGNGNHGMAASLTYTTGRIGAQAAQFNGTSSSVTIPRSVTDDFTVAMWVKTTDTAGSAGAQWWSGKGLVDGEVGGGGADWGTSIVNGKFAFGVGSTSGDTTVASSVNINDGTWHHLAATRNNTNGAVQVYVDGVPSGSGIGATGSRTLPAALRIGSLQTGNNFLNGALDDVRLYSRILTATEIAALATGAPPAAPTGLAANPGNGSIALSWLATAGATGYFIKRSTTSGGGYTTVGTVTGQTGFVDAGLTNGTTYYYVVAALNGYGEGADSPQLAATPMPQGPYGGTPRPVPGVIQAEDYDFGGQGFAYNDSDAGNNGGQYRSDGVDVETCTEGGYNVGWTAAGEWLETTVDVAHTGSYAITLRAASAWSQIQAHVEFGGVNVTGPMTAPATGGWQAYTDVTAPNVTLTAGQHVMRVFFDGGAWNLNHITLTANPLPAPQNVTATGGTSQIALSWSAVDGATGYIIKRSAGSGGPFVDLATGVSGTAYANTGLADGATWYYTVAAQGGESALPVSATTYTAVESWRFTNFGTIANSGTAADSADPDGDGWTNGQEYISGTDPNNRASLLKITQMQSSGNDMQLAFPSVTGRTYRVERSDTLLESSWSTVQDNIPGTGAPVQITDLSGAAQTRRFYRIVVW